jgi:hypothetical protein
MTFAKLVKFATTHYYFLSHLTRNTSGSHTLLDTTPGSVASVGNLQFIRSALVYRVA